jgi:hypothetical protein|tara:strand:+ start:331 stop:525 length:195 start_codon:yes stop_codon:yes gene_type:complete
VKVGDLVRVSYNLRPLPGEGYVSIVLEMDNGEYHPNGLQLVKVLENGQEQWRPVGYIEVINESR